MQGHLQSTEDTSDTLPTEVDKQLWEQQHQQTLQQQELQHRITLQQQQRSSGVPSSTAEPPEAPNAVPVGLTVQDALCNCIYGVAEGPALETLHKNSQKPGSSPNSDQTAEQQCWWESTVYEGSGDVSLYVGDDSTQVQLGRHRANVHSTIVDGSHSSSAIVLR